MRVTQMRQWVSVIGLVTALASCDEYVPPITSDYEIDEVSVNCSMTSNGEDVLITAYATVPEGEYPATATLGLNDTIAVSAEGAEPRTLTTRVDSFDLASVLATAAQDIEIALVRGSTRVEGVFELPAPFSLSVAEPAIRRVDPIDLTWEAAPETEEISIVVVGDCLVRALSRYLEVDTGSYSIVPADLEYVEGAGACELSVSLRRRRLRAPIDVGPTGGCDGTQVRTVAVEVAAP